MPDSPLETTDPVIERYRAFRGRVRGLNSSLLHALDRLTVEQGATRLGLKRRGDIVVRSEGARLALYEYCMFDVYHGGKNLVQRFLARVAPPTPEDAAAAESMLNARFRVVEVQRVDAAGRIALLDRVRDEPVSLIDQNLAASFRPGDLATVRTQPFEDAWISNGSVFNFTPAARDEAFSRLRRHGVLARYEHKGRAQSPESEVDVATTMLRTALDFGLDAQLIQRSA